MKTNGNECGWFVPTLGLVFIVLKLCHVIDWSWWWVLFPFWGFIVIIPVVLLFVLGVGGIFRIINVFK